MWWNSEQRLSLFTLRFSLELLLYGMWCIAGLPQQFLKHQKMLFRNPRPVLGHRIKHIACSLWLSVAKWFSQHFLCHCGCALIGCEWCHYTVYFSFSSEGKDQSVTCVSTLCQVVGKTLCVDLEPYYNHFLWVYDVASQWNTHQLCILCYLQLSEVSVYLGSFLFRTTFLNLVFELYS